MIARSPFPDVDIPIQSFPEYVFEMADKWQDKPALIDGASGNTLTYADMVQAIGDLAVGLREKGFERGDVMAIYSPNSPEYAVLFYAVISLGGVVTTINPLYTVQELAHQLKDVEARYLFAHPVFIEKADEAAGIAGLKQVFVFEDVAGRVGYRDLLGQSDGIKTVTVRPKEDVVVIPYSSGTTGLPKGVMLTHYNMVANIAQTLGAESLESDEVLIGILPFYHIYGMTVIMSMALRAGATIVTMPRFEVEHFLELMQDYKVTTAFIVPPIVLALAKDPRVDKYDLSSLENITSGAAPLPEAVATACRDRLGCVVKQGYGLTETSPVTHFNPRDGEIRITAAGLNVPNTETMIVDTATGDPVKAAGERGEIWIRGPQVMKGYFKNEAATRDMIDAQGWLHTGDIGYLDKDGFLYVVDRVKELIKYKGLQVAPAELEAVLQSHPDVADAAVIPRPDDEAGEVPKAFVVLKPGSDPTAKEIQDYVGERVAPYKKIRYLEFIDVIPKNPSGKILRRHLVERERREQAS